MCIDTHTSARAPWTCWASLAVAGCLLLAACGCWLLGVAAAAPDVVAGLAFVNGVLGGGGSCVDCDGSNYGVLARGHIEASPEPYGWAEYCVFCPSCTVSSAWCSVRIVGPRATVASMPHPWVAPLPSDPVVDLQSICHLSRE